MSWIKLSRSVCANFGLVLFSLVVSLSVAEIALRLMGIGVGERVDESIKTLKDPHMSMVLLPDQDGVDGRGYNNSQSLEVADIVAMGDSHTYGGHTSLGREDVSWPAKLHQLRGESVYNMGIWGYGTAQYRSQFIQALELHPKVIVVGMYIANDLFDTYDVVYHNDGWDDYRSTVFIDDAPITIADTKQIKVPLRNFRDWFNQKSALYALLGNQTRVFREKIGISKPVVTGTADWDYVDPDVSLRIDADNQTTLFWVRHRLSGVDLSDDRIAEGWRVTKVMYGEMAAMAQEQDVQFAIALIPSKMSAYFPLVDQRGLSNKQFDLVVSNETAIRLNMLTWCEHNGVVCVDVTSKLQQAIINGEVLYPPDRNEHPLPQGYALYAEAINEIIQ